MPRNPSMPALGGSLQDRGGMPTDAWNMTGGGSKAGSMSPPSGSGPGHMGMPGPELPTAPKPQPAPQPPTGSGPSAEQFHQTNNSNISVPQWQQWMNEGRLNPNGTWKSSKMCNGQPCPDSGDHPDACPDGWQAVGIDNCQPAGGGPGGGGAGGPGGPGGGGARGGRGYSMSNMFPYDPNQFSQFQSMWGALAGQNPADPTGDFYRKVLGGGPNPFEAMANQQLSEQSKMFGDRLQASGATGGQLALGTTMQNQQLASGAAQNRLDALQPALGFLGAQTEAQKDRNLQGQQAGWQGFLGGQGLGLERELGLGQLALGNRNADISQQLGLGQLDLGWEGAALDRDRFGEDRYRFDAGYGQGGMNREQDLLSMILNSQQGIDQRQQQGQAGAWGAGGSLFGQGMSDMFPTKRE